MIVRVLLIYSSDFNVCTDRARIYVLFCKFKEKEKNNVVLKMLL